MFSRCHTCSFFIVFTPIFCFHSSCGNVSVFRKQQWMMRCCSFLLEFDVSTSVCLKGNVYFFFDSGFFLCTGIDLYQSVSLDIEPCYWNIVGVCKFWCAAVLNPLLKRCTHASNFASFWSAEQKCLSCLCLVLLLQCIWGRNFSVKERCCSYSDMLLRDQAASLPGVHFDMVAGHQIA